MSPQLQLVSPDGRPTRPFLAAWAVKFGLHGLPATAVIVSLQGFPTTVFIGLAKPVLKLSPTDQVVGPNGKPTRTFLASWNALP